MSRLPLREVLLRLRKAQAFPDTATAGRFELFCLLREGTFVAHIPLSARILRTFPIPIRYWEGLLEGEFMKTLRRSRTTKGSTGDYLLPASRFLAEIVSRVFAELPQAEWQEELGSLASGIEKEVQVYVDELDYDRYFNERGLGKFRRQGDTAADHAGRGRLAVADWSEVTGYIAAYFLMLHEMEKPVHKDGKRLREDKKPLSDEQTAKEIVDQARQVGFEISYDPKATLAPQVRNVLKAMNKLRASFAQS